MTHQSTSSRAMLKRAIAATLLAAGLTAGASAPPAQADIVPVDIHLDGKTSLVPNKVDCTSTPGTCELYYRGTHAVSGGWQGHGTLLLHGHFTLRGFVGKGTDQETVTSGPCGSGTLNIVGDGVVSGIDLGRSALSGLFDWAVTPRSGTGQLRSVTAGNGINSFVLHPDGTYQGHVVGSMNCDPIGANESLSAKARHHRHSAPYAARRGRR